MKLKNVIVLAVLGQLGYANRFAATPGMLLRIDDNGEFKLDFLGSDIRQ